MTFDEYKNKIVDKNSQPLLERLKKHHEDSYLHSLRVSYLSYFAAEYTGIPFDKKVKCAEGALLHDIGKTHIPVSVLESQNLTPEQYAEIRNHPVKGYEDYIKSSSVDLEVAAIILQHHELLDGSGYPLQLTGTKLLKLTQIVTVADVYDALRSKRDYKKPWKKEEVLKYMLDNTRYYNEKYINVMGKMENLKDFDLYPG